MGSEARYCFDMSFTLRYIVCRVKMYLKLGDFCNAFAWLSLAHVKNDRDNIRKKAQLYVLDGKLFWAVCREQQERKMKPRRDGEGPTQRGRSTQPSALHGSRGESPYPASRPNGCFPGLTRLSGPGDTAVHTVVTRLFHPGKGDLVYFAGTVDQATASYGGERWRQEPQPSCCAASSG